ncbi:unnamed protein product [Didymodactylos carnosus]|uniref:Uncharacterized protein n=1 Tax=Didymodactylos carnosus TaxID=1234261 RepID=A0A8S2HQL4_9BILA|nr:unnamed protein product [Didymodactylos carnosus]CAF3672276.1 unnamed protein product [Didymodactylos carnosus]
METDPVENELNDAQDSQRYEQEGDQNQQKNNIFFGTQDDDHIESATHLLYNRLADDCKFASEPNMDNDDGLLKKYQQQIIDFYQKAYQTLPRGCCLLECYRTVMNVIAEIQKNHPQCIDFDEGDLLGKKINGEFIKHAKEYIDRMQIQQSVNDQAPGESSLVVSKQTVANQYEFHRFLMLQAKTLFTLRPLNVQSSSSRSTDALKNPRQDEYDILMYKYNIFHKSAMTDHDPDTGNRGKFKSFIYRFDEAIQKLLADELISVDRYCVGGGDRVQKTYWKVPIPHSSPEREQFVKKLNERKIEIVCYEQRYKHAKMAPGLYFGPIGIELFKTCAVLVPEYAKYQEEIKDLIQVQLKNQNIVETVGADGGKSYSITSNATVFAQQTFPIKSLLVTGQQTAKKPESQKSKKPMKSTSSSSTMPSITNETPQQTTSNNMPFFVSSSPTTQASSPTFIPWSLLPVSPFLSSIVSATPSQSDYIQNIFRQFVLMNSEQQQQFLQVLFTSPMIGAQQQVQQHTLLPLRMSSAPVSVKSLRVTSSRIDSQSCVDGNEDDTMIREHEEASHDSPQSAVTNQSVLNQFNTLIDQNKISGANNSMHISESFDPTENIDDTNIRDDMGSKNLKQTSAEQEKESEHTEENNNEQEMDEPSSSSLRTTTTETLTYTDVTPPQEQSTIKKRIRTNRNHDLDDHGGEDSKEGDDRQLVLKLQKMPKRK